jgi:hypothetical protein
VQNICWIQDVFFEHCFHLPCQVNIIGVSLSYQGVLQRKGKTIPVQTFWLANWEFLPFKGNVYHLPKLLQPLWYQQEVRTNRAVS